MAQSLSGDVYHDEFTTSIIEHWRNVISQTPAVHQPFEHIYIEKVWPDEVYHQLRNNLPPAQFYEPINIKRWVRANGESTRDRIKLTYENIEGWPQALQNFWLSLVRALYSDELKEAVFSKLKDDIALRLGITPQDVAGSSMFVAASLIRDTQEYQIKPHPDGYPRVVTMQFYLPESEDQVDLGTSLYVEEAKWRAVLGQRFREVKRFPFKPNSAYAFAVNDTPELRSLHGRELIGAASGVRNSILLAWQVEAPRKDKTSRGEAMPTRKVMG